MEGSHENKDRNQEQDSVLALLTDMFGDGLPLDRINEVGQESDWQVNACIEKLIQITENFHLSSPKDNDNSNKRRPKDEEQSVIKGETEDRAEERRTESDEFIKTINDKIKRREEYIKCIDYSKNLDNALINFYKDENIDNSDALKEDNQQLWSAVHGAIPKSTNFLPTTSSSVPTLNNNNTLCSSTDNSNNNSSNSSDNNKKENPILAELSEEQSKEPQKVDFSDILKRGFKEFVFDHSSSPSQMPHYPQKREVSDSQEVKKIIGKINAGYKVMVIMRGAPGSGKSYLARNLVDKTVKGDYKNHIFTTDDYFYDIHDRYVFRPENLPDAHEFNQKRVRRKAAEGWSPIIVDNTNIKIWEMLPYVKTAIMYGYVIELLEPRTEWSNSPSKMAQRNSHGVKREAIEKMLQNFERISATQLIRQSNVSYTRSIPQFRHHPPLSETMVSKDIRVVGGQNRSTAEEIAHKSITAHEDTASTNTTSWQPYSDGNYMKKQEIISSGPNNLEGHEENVESKPARKTPRHLKNSRKANEIDFDLIDFNTFKPREAEWKSYEEESSIFWKAKPEINVKKSSSADNFLAKPQRNAANFNVNTLTTNVPSITTNDDSKSIESKIIASLKPHKEENSLQETEMKQSVSEKLQRHKIGCKNESKSFAIMRQICPKIQLDGLWDLFEKCNGDADWAINLLLSNESNADQEAAAGCDNEVFFHCDCGNENSETTKDNDIALSNTDSKDDRTGVLVPEQFANMKSKPKKDKIITNSSELLEAKKAIEKQFVFGDEHYSNHLRKIRDMRYGAKTVAPCTSGSETEVDARATMENKENEDFEENDTSESEIDDMVEINLGKELIDQLENTFGDESGPKHCPDNYKTNVFMPKNLAKQLYALWMESLYNQIEEQKNDAIKEDQEFARLLQDPRNATKYENSPNNFKELMDMELAWSIYKSDREDLKNSGPKDLASHLTQMKLFEIFPDIEKDTLLEIYAAHKHNFADTVDVLKSSMNPESDGSLKSKGLELLTKAKQENEKQNEHQISEGKLKNSPPSDCNISERKSISQEEGKKVALKEFEQSRNMAVHHSQLKAECYLKAKEAIQKGNTAVAVYYSQIASLHKSKIDMYNHKAASCIMEVHDFTQNNPEIIDLHYLHSAEALECLDLFIDRHITKLKNICRSYKYIFIITGRGLHSAGGVSTIKNRVKSRLKERNLKWTEVNPGLLKVKIFAASRYSQSV